MLCELAGVESFVPLFYYMFQIVRQRTDGVDGPRELIRSWVMVRATSGNKFLHSYSDSYKNFKGGFLHLEAGDAEVPFWSAPDGSPRFPLEWRADNHAHSFEYYQITYVHLSAADLQFRRILPSY